MLAQNRVPGLLRLYALADYIPVMTEEEIVFLLNGCLPVDQPLIDKWEALLREEQGRLNDVFGKAYAKQR